MLAVSESNYNCLFSSTLWGALPRGRAGRFIPGGSSRRFAVALCFAASFAPAAYVWPGDGKDFYLNDGETEEIDLVP
ncbi:hypothetical protein OHD62_00985 [Mesorhizobium sp. YC-39]|uniref:hypothetical protein n=1 Tax=unclassified Mesorhizobium TaxID=325217 RepID=UPI0021E85846|nr:MULTISPECIES: hypothetical protein [unclassified Mesorhizobium]MCV3206671.1 hypothetical protein [Mesorhizobium sp. YC-2]MCV3226929.1 hypothetical protein [Mesorhizobium sp. YC-39]